MATPTTYDSLKLSVSGPGICCRQVAEHMQRVGILANTTPNLTNVDSGIEPGCSVNVHRVSKAALNTQVWQPLRAQFGLSCAHVHVPGVFSGCVYDFLRPSDCPGNVAGRHDSKAR
jgi:hypothetical protein